MRYEVYLTTLFVLDRENLRTILSLAVLPTVQGLFLCKNWHLC